MLKRETVMLYQKALEDQGFKPGPIDGLIGRRTLAALREFQKSWGLVQSGQFDTPTLQKLFSGRGTYPDSEFILTPTWIQLALQKRGYLETQARTRAFLKSDGHYLGDPAENPWCGDFIETCFALTLPNESLPANPYWARSWLKFGRSLRVESAYLGATMVFARGEGGHVTYLVGHDRTHYHCLGGNQSNGVTITKIAKTRLLGQRWPLTVNAPSVELPHTTIQATISTNEA